MVQFNTTQREITLKIVYYGPGLSGKTTNLQMIHQAVDAASRGRLMTLDTADDRTLFFDLLPVYFETRSGFKVKLKLYTVPGQVMHASTRRIVLSGADGVAFIASAEKSEVKANGEAWNSMMQNLQENGLLAEQVPVVVQFNKMDLPGALTKEEIDARNQQSKEPIFGAVAIRGDGVVETLFALLRLTFRHLNARHDFEQKFGLSEKDFLRNIFKQVNMQSTTRAG